MRQKIGLRAHIWNQDTITVRLTVGPYTSDSVKLWKADAKRHGFKLARREKSLDGRTLSLTFEREV